MKGNISGQSGKQNTIKSFLGRHNRLITFLGATIVLVTYLVKDELRDRAKDAADETNAAVSQFALQSEFEGVNENVKQLANDQWQEFDQVEADIKNSSKKKSSSTAQQIHDDLKRSFMSQAFLSNMNARVGLVYAAMGRVYGDRSQKMVDEYSAKRKKLSDDFDHYGQGRKPEQAMAELQRIGKELNDDETQCSQELADTEKQIYNLLLQKMNDATSKYAEYNKYAPFVYVFGWLAALLGRLIGVSGLGGDE